MKVLVQKFGGTSLATIQSRNRVVSHVQKALHQKYSVVVVVSAMGRKGDPYATDTLLDWVRNQSPAMPKRELDMLLACGEIISASTLCGMLSEAGIRSTVLTGTQAGLLTSGQYGNAQIRSVEPAEIIHRLKQGDVVIVTGFQGHDGHGNVTTLGRGGSDTTATAIGAALRAHYVDIYTDVGGVLTADPRIVHEAKKLHRMTYDEVSNMAQHGAKVIHPRAVELAMQARIPLRVRSTFANDEGTLITSPDRIGKPNGERPISDRYVTAIAVVSHISRIEVQLTDSNYDVQRLLFQVMAKDRISIDFINVTPTSINFTVRDDDANDALQLLTEIGLKPKHTANCAKVSVIGGGMNGVPGIMSNIVEALTEENITILQSADSNTTIWVLVQNDKAESAVRALHAKFTLHE